MEDQRIISFIEKAVKQAYNAGVKDGKKTAKECYKQTEAKLYAYPLLKKNIEKYKRDIEDMQREPLNSKSKDFIRLSSKGIRLSPEEVHAARIFDLDMKIQRDMKEVVDIDEAMSTCVKDDGYARVIEMKYFQGRTDEHIAEIISCDPSTIRRNKNRLVKKLSVFFYGADAL